MLRPKLFALFLTLLTAITLESISPAPAFDPNNDYELAQAFPKHAPRGPKTALGLILWNDSYFGPKNTEYFPPPPLIESLIAHGWDGIAINRNLAREDGWLKKSDQHAKYVAQQIANAYQYGYSRVIVAGYSFGASIALGAARLIPVYGVIAMTPQQVAAGQVQDIRTDRAFFMSPLGNVDAGFDQGPTVHQAANARGFPYMFIDKQVPANGGSSPSELRPYINCAISFFSPQNTPHPGEFHCYRDEAAPLLTAFGLNAAGAKAVWFGYLDTASAAVVVDRVTAAGEVADYAIGDDLLALHKGYVDRNLPARWIGTVFGFRTNGTRAVTVEPDKASGNWKIKVSEVGGTWTGALNLIAATK